MSDSNGHGNGGHKLRALGAHAHTNSAFSGWLKIILAAVLPALFAVSAWQVKLSISNDRTLGVIAEQLVGTGTRLDGEVRRLDGDRMAAERRLDAQVQRLDGRIVDQGLRLDSRIDDMRASYGERIRALEDRN